MKHIINSPKFLLLWGIVVLTVPNIVLSFVEKQPLLTALTNVLLPASVYMLLLTLSRRTGKMVWWAFPLTFLAAFQIVLLYLFGSGAIAVDMWLNLVTTNPTEAMELLDNLIPGLITVFGLYLPLIIISTLQAWKHIELPSGWQRCVRRIGAGCLIIGICLLIAARHRVPTFRTCIDIYPVNVVYNLRLAISRSIATARYEQTSRRFAFGTVATHDSDSAEVVILVVGETARAESFQLYGYDRPTTPHLCQMKNRLVTFTDVLTQSNTTHKSVPMLLSAVSAEDYDSIYHQKGVIAAFREAGYHTIFASNQRPNHSFIDFFGEEAHEVTFLKNEEESKAHYDTELLQFVSKALKQGHRRLFIVLHTYGSHFNYNERYPKSEAIFLPDTPADAEYKNRPMLINAYDNTIRGTDQLLHSLITMTDTLRTALLYTSDHGENIFDDDRRLFLHASPRPSAYELRIPFVVSLSPSYRQAYPEVAAALEANHAKPVSSNASVFHTLLDLAGLRTPLYRDSFSVASPHYGIHERFYLNDHNKAVPIQRLRLQEEDIKMLHKAQMAM